MKSMLNQTIPVNPNPDRVQNACSNNPTIFATILKNKSTVRLYCKFLFIQAEGPTVVFGGQKKCGPSGAP